MIKTWFSFYARVGNSVWAEVEKGTVFISVHLFPGPPGQPWESQDSEWPSLSASLVSASGRGCLWPIPRMCRSFFFVPPPCFTYLPSPGQLDAALETSCCHGDRGHNTCRFPKLKRPLVGLFLIPLNGTRTKGGNIMKENVCIELTLERAVRH